MISSQLQQEVKNYDEIISNTDNAFITSNLKMASLIRIFRLAVVDEKILIGSIGSISDARLQNIKTKLGRWLTKDI